jgi:ribonuclease Z
MGFRLTEVRWYIFRSFDSFCTEYPTSQRHTELCVSFLISLIYFFISSYISLPIAKVEAVLLTHFHSDHIDGLGEVLLQRWAGGEPSSPLPVYGGEGVEKVVKGFNDAYLLDKGYRVKHHGSSVIIPSSFGGVAKPFDISSIVEDYTKRVVVLQDDDLQIVAFSVRHEPIKPAVGFKFIYKGKTLVISGDTSKVDSVAREAKDVDLLIHEGLSPRLLKILEQNFESVGNGHLRQIM